MSWERREKTAGYEGVSGDERLVVPFVGPLVFKLRLENENEGRAALSSDRRANLESRMILCFNAIEQDCYGIIEEIGPELTIAAGARIASQLGHMNREVAKARITKCRFIGRDGQVVVLDIE